MNSLAPRTLYGSKNCYSLCLKNAWICDKINFCYNKTRIFQFRKPLKTWLGPFVDLKRKNRFELLITILCLTTFLVNIIFSKSLSPRHIKKSVHFKVEQIFVYNNVIYHLKVTCLDAPIQLLLSGERNLYRSGKI